MPVEQQRIFNHGYVLAESSLRRIVDTMKEQILKVDPSFNDSEKYIVKFKNGVIADIYSLEDVLGLENGGSRTIIELSICLESPDQKTRIQISYINIDNKESSASKPIELKILGEERDWVFVTSSLLEERLGATKKFSCRHFFGKSGYGKTISYLTMMCMLGFMFFTIISIDPNASQNQAHVQLIEKLDKIEKLYNEKKITDPVAVILQLKRIDLAASDFLAEKKVPPAFKYFMFAIIPLMLIVLLPEILGNSFQNIFPRYIFSWGETDDLYQKAENKKKFLWGGIVLSLVISYFGGALANIFPLP